MRILTSHKVKFSVRDFNKFPHLTIHICRRTTSAGNRCYFMPLTEPLRQFRTEHCGMLKRFVHTLKRFVYTLLNGRHLWEFSTGDVIARLPPRVGLGSNFKI